MSNNAALCNDRSVSDWMFNISKKNIKHHTISTLNESLRGLTKDSRKQLACFILPLNIIKHSSQINVWVPYRLFPYPGMHRFLYSDTSRLKSIKVENHKKLWNRLLSISDTCQLISIEFDLQ